ncbi:hypothetical protein [Cryobacterium sp. TMT1-19]|uniref:hypothetical protein n=1 Tax=Cryobacterium sp. TMT1-19 TaxID=1259231 RepID=UPI00141B707D|nr:hypothetical protein [Cryobacterium sp. TMT1-19]
MYKILDAYPAAGELLPSSKDVDAPSLRSATESGLLPTWAQVRGFNDLRNENG